MIENILARPWMFFALVLLIVLLSLCAIVRSRRDLNLKQRTGVPRRKGPRANVDRRWDAQRKKK